MNQTLIGKKTILCFLVIFFTLTNFNLNYFTARADEISDARKSLEKTEKKLEKEQIELEKNQSNLSVTQGQINTTASLIDKTAAEIFRKEAELKNLEKRMELNKNILIAYAQEMYFSDQEASWALTFSNKSFNDYLGNFDQMLSAKEKLLTVIGEIKEDKEDIEGTKQELAEKKEEHQELLMVKQSEKNVIVVDINETKLTIAQLQAKLSKLRSVLSSFLGGSYSMDDVIDTVKFAEKKTGVRKEFLFAMLDKETDLGRFTGGCTYNKSKMGSTNEKIFKETCKELGYNYKKMKVSCPLSYGIGGAMGVAQFMPTTWVGYKNSISKYTGNIPADPWDLKDGIVGMALKLKAAGGANKSKEHYAASVYYCGSRLSRAVCQNYANTVISWSKGYDDYF